MVVAAAEGVVPTVAEGVGAGGEGGRRLPRRVVNLSAALRRRRGRYYFLLFPLLLFLLLLLSSSFWSQRVFARSSRLRRSSPFFRYHLFEVARVVLLPSSSSSRLSVRLVLTRSFDVTLRVSIHLRILLRSFARAASEVARSRLQQSLMRVHSFPLSPSRFLPLRIGKQSARCLLSSHSTCLLTQASCPARSISLVACVILAMIVHASLLD